MTKRDWKFFGLLVLANIIIGAVVLAVFTYCHVRTGGA